MRIGIIFVSTALFACSDTHIGSAPQPLSQPKQEAADQQGSPNTQPGNLNTPQESAEQNSNTPKLDVLVITRHRWHGSMRTSTSTNKSTKTYADEQKAHADKIAAKLGELPAKIAAYDYKIALAGNTTSNCIQAFVTPSNADPAADLQDAFWQINKGVVTPHGHISSISAGTAGYFVAFQNLIAALTDINYTGVWSGQMPTADNTDYFTLPDNMIEERDDNGNPYLRYRQFANGLLVVDYYDTDRSVTCNRPWLREDALLAIVIIDYIQGHFPCVNWKFCTMPDIEQALRDAGKLQNSGDAADRSYRLYALAAYQEVFNYKSKRNSDHSIPNNMRVDWQDFKTYIISNSSNYLADYLGDATEDADYKHVFDDIVAAMGD